MIKFNSIKEVGEELEKVCSEHGLNICYDVEGYYDTMKPIEKLIFLKTRYIDLMKLKNSKKESQSDKARLHNGKPLLKGGKNKKC